MIKTLLLSFLFTFSFSSEFINKSNNTTAVINDFLLFSKEPTTGLIVDNLLIDLMITSWGYKHWAWGEESLHFKSEKWFQEDSATGGSDKTGHFYMTYLLSRVLASRMQDRGWSLEDSSLAGAISGMFAMTLLEVGDGTSPYGFSKEDLLSDGLGALSAYLIRSNPKVDKFIDIRLEYFPTASYLAGGDNTTDYSGMKHLVAFQFKGFEQFQSHPLRFVEVQVGYYARGYRTFDVDIAKSQQAYIGIGINLSELANESGINLLKNLFEFYQPGSTYLETNLWQR